MRYISMNYKEIEQAKIFEQIKNKTITQLEGAAKFRISDRYVRQKIKRYYTQGVQGIVHKNRGRASNRRWNIQQKQILIDLLEKEWQGFGPTFASEKLKNLYSIKVSKETVRKVMIKENLWRAKAKTKKHSISQAFYTDHGSVFHVNLNNAEEEKKTQWERAIHELDITVHHKVIPKIKLEYNKVPRKPNENSRRWASGLPQIHQSRDEAGQAGHSGDQL